MKGVRILDEGRIREEVVQVKGVGVKEGAFRRRRREVGVNNVKFVVGIFDEVLKFSGKGRNGLNDARKIA